MIRRCRVPRPQILIPEDRFSEDEYVEVEWWDPYFWEKATHYRAIDTYNPDGSITTHYRNYYKVNEYYGRLDGGNGYVYVLTCASQPGLCKIGSTTRTPEERLREINGAPGVIVPWEIAAAYRCKAPECVEKLVHKDLDDVRVVSNREGFVISVEDAGKAITKVINEHSAAFKIKDAPTTNWRKILKDMREKEQLKQ